MDEIYYLFYVTQFQLIVLYQKIENMDIEMSNYFRDKNVFWFQRRETLIESVPRILF